jgi:hypothetical protein
VRWPVLVVVAAALAGCGDGGDDPGDARAEQVRDAALEAGLDGDVADVLATAARAADATYTVTYDVDGGTVVVTQRPPDRRIEVTSADGGVDATITTGGRTVACSDPPGDPPVACEDIGQARPGGAFDEDAVAAFTAALTEDSDGFTIRSEERTVAGVAARCVVATEDADESVLCVADTGAVLLVERPAGSLRATSYSNEVGDGAIDLPAGTG